MHGYVDLHCHFLAGIDDGARSDDEGLQMLQKLAALGFERVVATPHMRPGMFDNDKRTLQAVFERMQPRLTSPTLPRTDLSSEHYFDDQVFARILAGDGLPYPGGKAVLLEFYQVEFPPAVDVCFAKLRRSGILPVIAHPERYQCLWKSLDRLERLVDGGAAALLDTAALAGKYGSVPQRCAEQILERELYHAACSDAHRPADVDAVAAGIKRIKKLYGDDECEFLFKTGPNELLAGRLPRD
ncbi:MAG: protein tyrosine phosphatase [Polyangiaceae bacterium]